jgi:outer membrane protein OmpA-like peptidoglycan-associated protein
MRNHLVRTFISVALGLSLAATARAASVKTDKTEYLPNDPIQIEFTASASWPPGAWVGLVPSNIPHGSAATNDQHDAGYEYLSGRASGTITLPAPAKPGSWDVRMNDSEEANGKEVASTTFRVVRPSAKATLKVTPARVMPGDEIQVQFTITGRLPDDAWLGIVPSNIPHGSEQTNDENDRGYEYIHSRSAATVTLTAPDEAGAYDIRLNDSDAEGGVEIASVPFQVGAPSAKVTLQLARNRFIPGEPLAVKFTVDGELPDSAWAGIVPSKVEHGSEEVNDRNDVDYEYLKKRTSGTLDLRAPVDAGSYDVRVNDSDSSGREIASISFQVSGTVTAADLKQQLATTGHVSLYGIRFDTGKAEIKPEAAAVLAQVGQLLTGDPSLRLRIEGHTDDVGDDAANLQLSKRRAEAVKAYLASHFQVDAARLDAQGFGETRPVADNKTEAGKAQNRRVELVKE